MTSWFRRRDHNIFTNATSLLICGLLAGVVVAAAAFPAAAMTGLAAKAGGQTFADLPSELKEFSSPQITRVYAADGKTQIALFYDEFRSDVPLKDISKHMQTAILAAEDRKFYDHKGVDLKGVARAFVSNNQGGSQQGASTLTMQYVRMSLAYSATNPQEVIAATEDSPKRKVTEMKYALQIEEELSKDQILERYLNIAPFGNQAYGVYAASQVYFNKRPKDLNVAEAAMLAGMVKAPSSFNPTTPTGNEQITSRRDNYIVPAMLEMGAITQPEADEAKKVKVPDKVKQVGRGCAWVTKNHWGFFCDYFHRWWLDQEAFGSTTYDRERRLKSGGYRIVTTMDVEGTAAARKQVSEQQSDNSEKAVLLAGVEPGDGKVRLLAANRKYKIDDPDNPQNKISSDPKKARAGLRGTHPNTTNPLLSGGGDITGYQAGSVFKIFPIIAALEAGYPLSYPIKAEKQYRSNYIVGPGPATCDGNKYCPKNSGGGGDKVYNMWSGFANSINTYFIPLQERVGADKVVAVAKRFGVQFRVPDPDALYANEPSRAKQWGAFSLGVSASTPLDMANAYATLAADGKYCTPTPIEQISTQDGQKIDVGKPHCIQATDKNVARAALDAARCPVGDSAQLGSCDGGTARPTRGIVDHPVFGKSGTTDSEKTASLIVGTTKIVVAGYLANPDYPDHKDAMKHDIINPAVQYTVRDYMKGKPKENFKKPTAKIAHGEQRSIPGVKCDSVSSATNRLEDAGFYVSRGAEVASECPAGTVASTSPSGRTVKNGAVVLEISNGQGNGPNPNASTPAAGGN